MTEPIPHLADVSEAPPVQIGRLAKVIRETVPEDPEWLVPGLLAPGTITEVNGREKIGKGYLLHYLVGALERGVDTFRGPSRQASTLIYTEEPTQSLKEKFDLFDINDAMVVYQWELQAKPWLEVVDWLVYNAVERGDGLIYVDNVSAATQTQDEAGVELARKIEPLGAKAKEHGLAVMYDRHQRKAQGKIEDASRGSTSMAGAVDAILAITRGDMGSRERTLTSWGRLWKHNWTQQVELTEDHKDYLALEGDWKTRMLLERDEWTAKDFAQVIGKTDDTARQYLRTHPNVEEQKGRGPHGADLYVVTKAPSID